MKKLGPNAARRPLYWILVAAFILGLLATVWVPPEFFLTILGAALPVWFVLTVIVSVQVKRERHAPTLVALMLNALWLPSSNGELKAGRAFSMWLGVSGFLGGMLICAIALGAIQ